MTLNRPPPPADDLTQVAARRTRSRRSDAPKRNETRVRRRSTILQVARTGRQSRRPRRFWNTPRASRYRPTSCHHSSTLARCCEPCSTDCWDEATVGSTTSVIKSQQVCDGSRRRFTSVRFLTDHPVDSSEHVSEWARARYIYSRTVAYVRLVTHEWSPGTHEWSQVHTSWRSCIQPRSACRWNRHVRTWQGGQPWQKVVRNAPYFIETVYPLRSSSMLSRMTRPTYLILNTKMADGYFWLKFCSPWQTAELTNNESSW